MKNTNFPRISFVLCTYYGERTLDECLSSFFNQDYPKEKIELIIADGGSKDKTLEIIKKYSKKYPQVIKFMHNKKQYSDGKGMGIDTASRKTKFEIIGFIDQDNIFTQKNWIKEMVKPLILEENISAVQSKLIIPEKGSLVEKYFGATGVEDPFAIPYSLTAQVIFNPKKFQYSSKGNYYFYKLSKKRFLYGGNNGCLVKRDKFFEAGGYNQDNDEFYRFALKNYVVAVPKNTALHHASAVDFKHFLIKRGKYVVRYLAENYENRDFYWFNLEKNDFSQNLKFIRVIIFNLLIFPGIIQGILMVLKEKKKFWLVHPIMLFSITLDYLLSFLYVKLVNKKVRLDLSKQASGKK